MATIKKASTRRGPKGKYGEWITPEGQILIQGWARDGLTNDDIAARMDINRRTLQDWRHKYPEIDLALKKGKEVVDFAVENALLQKAMKGDVTAQIFWLKNRRPDKWRDRQAAAAERDTGQLEALIKGLQDNG